MLKSEKPDGQRPRNPRKCYIEVLSIFGSGGGVAETRNPVFVSQPVNGFRAAPE